MSKASLTTGANMMLGYADNRAKDVYSMLNLEINKVILMHDIVWLQEMFGE